MNKNIIRIAAVFVVCLSGTVKPVVAAELPALDQKVSITVREQPVQQFLNTLFAQVRVPVVVSEDIEGLMNGKFEGSARHVFNDISKAFNVTMYFDGAVAYIYSSNEISRTVMPVSLKTAQRIEKIATKMSLGDSQNKIDSSGGGGLMVTGTRRYLEQIEELSSSVKANSIKKTTPIPTKKAEPSPLAYQVFYLSNAWAADTNFNVSGQEVTISGVATLLKELVADGRLPSSSVQRTPSRSKNSLDGLRGQGLQSVGIAPEQPINTLEGVTPQHTSVSDARIVADSRLNAIIIRDAADRMNAYKELISDLDRPSQMVEIEATIIDINTDKTRELGIGWEYRGSDASVSLFGGAGSQAGLISPSIAVQGPGAILSTVLGGREQFLSRIKALEEKGAARIVSKPHVITLSDVEAILGATTEFFVRVEGTEEVDLFNVPVGTTLRVTPHAFTEQGQSRIKLIVNIEDGTTSSQQVDQIPIVERANINTQAVINEGDSLLIGGLVRESYQQVVSSVPVLGNIPVLGRLFKSTANQSSRVERLFMITPRTSGGLGFGRTNNGRRDLPVLQGDAEDIVAQAVDRVITPNQPFGRTVNDIPFEGLRRPEIENPVERYSPTNTSTKPAIQNPQVPSTPVNNEQEWVTVTMTNDTYSARETSVKSIQPTSTINPTLVDDDGWQTVK